MKSGAKIPRDLDAEARKKWRELVDGLDPSIDLEALALYCRQHSLLLAIRAERVSQVKQGTFKQLVKGRDGSDVLNPMLREENRLSASLARMLRTLGLAPLREEQTRRKPISTLPPPGMTGPEPRHGWAVEIALCAGLPNPTPADLERDQHWEEWLREQGKRS